MKKKDIADLTHGAKMEELVWNEFNSDREKLVYETEKIIEKLTNKSVENIYLQPEELNYSSQDKVKLAKRPLLKNLKKAKILHNQRDAEYEKVADFTVDVRKKSLQEIVEEIQNLIKE